MGAAQMSCCQPKELVQPVIEQTPAEIWHCPNAEVVDREEPLWLQQNRERIKDKECAAALAAEAATAAEEAAKAAVNVKTAAITEKDQPKETKTERKSVKSKAKASVKSKSAAKPKENDQAAGAKTTKGEATPAEKSKEIKRLLADAGVHLCNWAAEGQVEKARMLLQAGAGVDEKGKEGRFPLHVAAAHNSEPFAKLLIEFKADINQQSADKVKDTPLHAAARAGATTVAKLLVHAGAKVELKNGEGQTALDIAEDKAEGDIVRVIKLKRSLTTCKTRIVAGMAFSGGAKKAS